MLKWAALTFGTFALGSETSSILEAAAKGQSLTDRGVWIGLLGLMMIFVIWFARIQFNKEAKLTEQLQKSYEDSTERIEKLTQECTLAAKENIIAMHQLRSTLESMREDLQKMDSHQQQAALLAQERDKRRHE